VSGSSELAEDSAERSGQLDAGNEGWEDCPSLSNCRPLQGVVGSVLFLPGFNPQSKSVWDFQIAFSAIVL
jgi:hypothetical protein